MLHVIYVCVRRVNTFASKVKIGKDKYHAVHEYQDTLKNIYLDEFLTSMEFQDFARRTGKTSISYGIFLKGALMCPCIRAPVMRVCVDETETAFNELVHSLNKVRKKSRSLRKPECECGFCNNEKVKKNACEAGGKNVI